MQPTPTVTRADVDRVVRRDFPSEDFDRVIAILDDYGPNEWDQERDRVQLAVLKLAAGNSEHLRYQIEAAKCDYRDVFLSAEYPGYAKKMFKIDKLPAEQRQHIIDSDWKQYQEWLTR